MMWTVGNELVPLAGPEIDCADGLPAGGDPDLIDCADPTCMFFSRSCKFDSTLPGVLSGNFLGSHIQLPGTEDCISPQDDDLDGWTNCSDRDCRMHPICGHAPLTGETICTGWLDEDGDGFVDCADRDCRDSVDCQTTPVPPG